MTTVDDVRQLLREARVYVAANEWSHQARELLARIDAALERRCPAPIGDDDGTARQCIERGHCGCDEATPPAAAPPAEPVFTCPQCGGSGQARIISTCL